MRTYEVSWVEEIKANSEEEAADKARQMLLSILLDRHQNIQFTVLDPDGGKGSHLTLVKKEWQ